MTKSDVYFRDSFFTILGNGGVIEKHNHIGKLDRFPKLDLWKQKFSLVYYIISLKINNQDFNFRKK